MKYIAAIFVITILVLACSGTADDPYIREILKARSEQDSVFGIQGESPLDSVDIINFTGLEYFDVDMEYRVMASFIINPDPVPFEMPTTTERRPVYVHFGTAHFELNGKTLKLNIYQNQDLIKRPGYEDYLFIPFRDLTSAKESYGGGRFMDGRLPEGDSILIDFNTAYNPYCAYSHHFSCPIPPEENTLDVEIRAGEKTWAR